MYCNPKLKLNRFKEVNLPSNAEYFSKFGPRKSLDAGYTPTDDDGKEIPIRGNKVDQIAAMDAFDRSKARQEAKAKKTEE